MSLREVGLAAVLLAGCKEGDFSGYGEEGDGLTPYVSDSADTSNSDTAATATDTVETASSDSGDSDSADTGAILTEITTLADQCQSILYPATVRDFTESVARDNNAGDPTLCADQVTDHFQATLIDSGSDYLALLSCGELQPKGASEPTYLGAFTQQDPDTHKVTVTTDALGLDTADFTTASLRLWICTQTGGGALMVACTTPSPEESESARTYNVFEDESGWHVSL